MPRVFGHGLVDRVPPLRWAGFGPALPCIRGVTVDNVSRTVRVHERAQLLSFFTVRDQSTAARGDYQIERRTAAAVAAALVSEHGFQPGKCQQNQ